MKPFLTNKGHMNGEQIILKTENETTDNTVMAEMFNSHYINITKKLSGKKPFYSRLFSKCDHIRSFLRIWSHLLKKSLIESFIFFAVIDLIARSYLDHSSINRMKSTSKNEIPSITSSSNFCGTNAEKYLNFCVHLTQKSC